MENPPPRPDTINALRFGADAALAMLAGMQLEVFTSLQHGPMTAEQIADAIGVAPTRLPLLLYALVAAELLTEQNGSFSNTPEGQHFLVKDAPSYMGYIHTQHSHRWGIMLKTAASLHAGAPQAHVDFSQAPQEALEGFLRRNNVISVAAAHALIERYDFSSTATLVDVGGGAGGVAITLAKACPHLRATVVDLPRVAQIAEKIVEEEEVTDRVRVLTADVVHGSLPGSYDVAVVKSLLQVLSPDDARRGVKNTGAAMNPGGMIYIISQILDNSRTSPLEAVEFNLVSINQYGTSEAYTEHEHREWLSEAGFVDIERPNVLLAGYGLITARKRG